MKQFLISFAAPHTPGISSRPEMWGGVLGRSDRWGRRKKTKVTNRRVFPREAGKENDPMPSPSENAANVNLGTITRGSADGRV